MREEYLAVQMHALRGRCALRTVRYALFDFSGSVQVRDFFLILIRCCDRALYHSLNTSSSIVSTLDAWSWATDDLAPGHNLYTHNEDLKYEIDAFLTATKTLLELPKRSGRHAPEIDRLLEGEDQVKEDFLSLFVLCDGIFTHTGVTNAVRNAATHTTENMKDKGICAYIVSDGGGLQVACPHLYTTDQDPDVDMVKVYLDVDHTLTGFIDATVQKILSYLPRPIRMQLDKFVAHMDSKHCRVQCSFQGGVPSYAAYELGEDRIEPLRRLREWGTVHDGGQR